MSEVLRRYIHTAVEAQLREEIKELSSKALKGRYGTANKSRNQ